MLQVRNVGVSNESSYGVAEFVHAARSAGLPKIVSIQNCYSLVVRSQYETNLAETCHKHGVGLLAYSPMAGRERIIARVRNFFIFLLLLMKKTPSQRYCQGC